MTDASAAGTGKERRAASALARALAAVAGEGRQAGLLALAAGPEWELDGWRATTTLDGAEAGSAAIVVCDDSAAVATDERRASEVAAAVLAATAAVVAGGPTGAFRASAESVLEATDGTLYRVTESEFAHSPACAHLELALGGDPVDAFGRLRLDGAREARESGEEQYLVLVKPLADPAAAGFAAALHELADARAENDRLRAALARRDARVADLSAKLESAIQWLVVERRRAEHAKQRLDRLRSSPAWPLLAAAYRASLAAGSAGRRLRRRGGGPRSGSDSDGG